MIINPSTDIDIHSTDINKFECEEGMQKCEQKQVFNRLKTPVTLTPGNTTTFNDVAVHMLYRQRLTYERVHKMLTCAGNLTKKYDIDFLHPNYEQFIHFMDYLEHVEQKSPFILKWIWQITQKFLTAFSIPYGTGTPWDYHPPSQPPSKTRKIILPDTMYNIVNHKYTKDDIKNKFIQYTITHSSILGWRNPSELCLMKLQDIDYDNNIITLTEKKKHNRKRILITDYPQIINSKQVKSILNWIDIWRPRIETQYSQDYLYISPTDGRPLRQMQYTRYINYYVNPIYPEFKLYDTRHFCGTGLFIREILNNGHWNKHKVKRWLGHELDQTTDTYIAHAEQYMKIAPYDWFKRVLKNQYTKQVEDNTLKPTNTQNKALSKPFTPILFGNFQTNTYNATEEKPFDKTPLFGIVDFQPILIKPFFLSLQNYVGVGA